MYERINQITEEQFNSLDEKATKTVFNKYGTVIYSGEKMYLKTKENEYFEVEDERKPLGILFNRYWR
jgi:hypothetical protein